MKRILTTFAFIASILSSCITTQKEDLVIKDFNSISKSVKSEFAPDRRDKTFEVSIEKTSKGYQILGSTTEAEAKEVLLSKLKEKNIEFEDNIVLLPDAELGETIYGVVSSSVGSFRYGSNYSAEMATQSLMGTPLRILEKESYWLRVITPEGYTAWITEGSVKRMNKTEYDAWKVSKRMVVTDHLTLFRSAPNKDADVVMDGVWGNIVEYMAQKGDYYQVKLPAGQEVFVPSKDVVFFDQWLASRNPTPANIIKQAKQFLGFPYLWGGTSPKAMDCSGFTKTTYFLNGVVLKRDASQQAKTGENIEITGNFENLEMGDLLFFGSKATAERGERITHVGIYIEDGSFIHCATNVKINSLYPNADDYYTGSTRLVRAQRMLGNQDKCPGITSIINHPWYL